MLRNPYRATAAVPTAATAGVPTAATVVAPTLATAAAAPTLANVAAAATPVATALESAAAASRAAAATHVKINSTLQIMRPDKTLYLAIVKAIDPGETLIEGCQLYLEETPGGRRE